MRVQFQVKVRVTGHRSEVRWWRNADAPLKKLLFRLEWERVLVVFSDDFDLLLRWLLFYTSFFFLVLHSAAGRSDSPKNDPELKTQHFLLGHILYRYILENINRKTNKQIVEKISIIQSRKKNKMINKNLQARSFLSALGSEGVNMDLIAFCHLQLRFTVYSLQLTFTVTNYI